MLKRYNLARFLILLLLLTLSASCLVSSTFAKYTSSASSSDIARVARWSVSVGPDGGVHIGGGTFTFDPFKYIYDTERDENGLTVREDAVKTDADNPKIAPGTEGRFAFDLVNNSEVTAAYTVKFAIENPNNVPLLFSIDGANWVDTIEELNDIEERAGVKALQNVFIDMQGGFKTVVVYWKWLYEQDGNVEAGNIHDTNLGIEHPTVRMSATATVTQVD